VKLLGNNKEVGYEISELVKSATNDIINDFKGVDFTAKSQDSEKNKTVLADYMDSG
jgi:hypothetical protein